MRTTEQTGLRLVRAVIRAARSVTARVEPLLKAEGLTVDQWLILDALAGTRNATMTELANATLLTGPTLTRVVDRLVVTAVAFREVDATDRRKVRVYLSARGRVTHRRISGKLADVEAQLLARAIVGPGGVAAGSLGVPGVVASPGELLDVFNRLGD